MHYFFFWGGGGSLGWEMFSPGFGNRNKEVAGVMFRNAHKKMTEQRLNAHLLLYSFLFFKLLLGFGLDFEFGLGLTLGL